MKKRIYTKRLIPGMKSGENVYDGEHLVFSKGYRLNEKAIEKLIECRIDSIIIDIPDEEAGKMVARQMIQKAEAKYEVESDPISKAALKSAQKSVQKSESETESEPETDSEPTPVPEQKKDTRSYAERLRSSAEFKEFQANYDQTIFQFTNTMNDIVEKNKKVQVDEMFTPAMNKLINGHSKSGIFDILSNIRHYDDATYEHCLNVALLSNILATWLRFSDEDVKLATACGLLHDIGKLTIPEEIVKKPGKLTEQEYNIIKMHTVNGYNILKRSGFDNDVIHAALHHHEKYDGSGYPLGVSGQDINRFGRLVAIADVYDAMTAERVYRGSLCPFKVISIFEQEGLQKYDPEYILTFLEKVVDTYINNDVRLSDGRIGKVVFVNRKKLSLPMVAIEGNVINLANENGVTIEEII